MKFLICLTIILLGHTLAVTTDGTMAKSRKSTWPKLDEATNASEASKLESHLIDCGIGSLAGFQLQKVGAANIKYISQCITPLECNDLCKAAIKKIDERYCTTQETPPSDMPAGVNNANLLTNHKVACGKDFVLKSFQLVRDGSNVRYKYSCCPAITNGCTESKIPAIDLGDKSIMMLAGLKAFVADPITQAMTSFQLVEEAGKYTYSIGSCKVTG